MDWECASTHMNLFHEMTVKSKFLAKARLSDIQWGEQSDEEARVDDAAQSEQIPREIVLTAPFPYVIRFITESSSVDGLWLKP